MGKALGCFLFLALFFCSTGIAGASNKAIKEKLTAQYYTDINGDGKRELLVHDFYGGTAGFGELRIYNSKGILIFRKKVEGDPYLWHPVKHVQALNPDFFPDLDKDGIVEILVGYRGEDGHVSHVDEPWWFDIYKWNGKAYILADDQFPGFYKEELSGYKSFAKEKGECELIREYIRRAERFAGLEED
ncbi:VCBS repeat-containing protein [Candidatus Saganbacteria bacterium]|nr:VCBS repeat-containing protein [Candidatus Saganbacteria bacterium]